MHYNYVVEGSINNNEMITTKALIKVTLISSKYNKHINEEQMLGAWW